jgi:hypothetical protein
LPRRHGVIACRVGARRDGVALDAGTFEEPVAGSRDAGPRSWAQGRFRGRVSCLRPNCPPSSGGGATGFFEFPLFIRNVGGTRCRLSGYPRHARVSEPGQKTVTAQLGGPFDGSVMPSHSVPPGGRAMLVIATQNNSDCLTPRSRLPYHRVAIAPGTSRGVITTRRAFGLDVDCRVFATKFARVN